MTPDDWRRIDECFHAALARAPDERGPLLDELCRDRPDLRTHVDDLLSWEGRADSFLSEAALQRPGDAASPEARPSVSPGAPGCETSCDASSSSRTRTSRDRRTG